MSSETNKKIKSAVAGVIPRLQNFTIYASDAGFDEKEVVRVITPAWRRTGKAERIAKVQEAVWRISALQKVAGFSGSAS